MQEEKAFSEEASSLVNTAYSTLKSPLDRAIYLVRSAATQEDLSSGRRDTLSLSLFWIGWAEEDGRPQ